jgi:hypothetical protein
MKAARSAAFIYADADAVIHRVPKKTTIKAN